MRPLRIAMIGSRGIPAAYSGIEKALEELCPRLVERGHEVTVYGRLSGSETPGQFRGVRIEQVPAINTNHLETITRVALSVWRDLRRASEIVHFHALGPGLFSGLPRLFARKTVVTVQGLDWRRRKWGWFARQFLKAGEFASARFPDATIVVSPVLKEYYDRKYGLRTTYIPNGVSLPAFRAPDRIVSEHGLGNGDYVLFASRLVPEKGCHYLIEAFRSIATDLRLVIAGGSAHTDTYVEDLHSLAGSDSRIIFVGHAGGALLEELFSNAHLYVLPSEIEGLSISLLEAMSYGRCVVTSDIPENVRVTRETWGFSFRNRDVDDLARTLRRLLRQPEQVWITGSAARKHVGTEYGWDRIAEQTEAVYLALCTPEAASDGAAGCS